MPRNGPRWKPESNNSSKTKSNKKFEDPHLTSSSSSPMDEELLTPNNCDHPPLINVPTKFKIAGFSGATTPSEEEELNLEPADNSLGLVSLNRPVRSCRFKTDSKISEATESTSYKNTFSDNNFPKSIHGTSTRSGVITTTNTTLTLLDIPHPNAPRANSLDVFKNIIKLPEPITNPYYKPTTSFFPISSIRGTNSDN